MLEESGSFDMFGIAQFWCKISYTSHDFGSFSHPIKDPRL